MLIGISNLEQRPDLMTALLKEYDGDVKIIVTHEKGKLDTLVTAKGRKHVILATMCDAFASICTEIAHDDTNKAAALMSECANDMIQQILKGETEDVVKNFEID